MGTVRVTLLSGLAVIASIFVGPSGAGAVSPQSGTISGTVMECGPGPIVASPTVPIPKPISVSVEHDGRVIESESVKLPTKVPWTGSFTFTVPPGRYEVISSYEDRARWVSVKPHSRNVVSFGFFACPM